MGITLYTRPNCPHCERAKAALDKAAIKYETVSMPEKEHRESFYDSISDDMAVYPSHLRRTMPKMNTGDIWVPSADDIVDMVKFGLL